MAQINESSTKVQEETARLQQILKDRKKGIETTLNATQNSGFYSSKSALDSISTSKGFTP